MLPPRTQGYFLLLVQEKVAKENDTPDGATFRCASCCAKSPGRTVPVRPFAGTTVHRTVVCIRLTPAHPRFRVPALILRGILPRRSGADILSAPLSGRSPGTLRCAGAPYGDPKTTPIWPLPFTDASGQQTLPIQHGQMGVVPIPVGASECCAGCANVAKARDGRERPAQCPQGLSRASCSSPRRVFKRSAS